MMEIEESINFWMYLLRRPWKIRQKKSSFILIRQKPIFDVHLRSELAMPGVELSLTHEVRVRYRGFRDEFLFFSRMVGPTKRKYVDQVCGESLHVKHVE